MTAPSRADLLRLPVSERIRLVEDLWDSIADCPGELPLTDAQREALDGRLEAWRANLAEGSSWETVRARIQNPG